MNPNCDKFIISPKTSFIPFIVEGRIHFEMICHISQAEGPMFSQTDFKEYKVKIGILVVLLVKMKPVSKCIVGPVSLSLLYCTKMFQR